MLIKKELIEHIHTLTPPRKNDYSHVAVDVKTLPRSGEVLIATMRTKQEAVTFFCDRANYIFYYHDNDEWNTVLPYAATGKWGHDAPKDNCAEEQRETVCRFLDTRSVYAVGRIINIYTREHERGKRWDAAQKIVDRMNRHLKMFPDTPKGFERWAIEKLFPAYGIMENVERGKPKKWCTCSVCGKRWKVTKDTRHKQIGGVCPKCGRALTYYARRYVGSIRLKTPATLCHNADGVRMFEYGEATLSFDLETAKPRVMFGTKKYCIFPKGERKAEYNYAWVSVPYYGWDVRPVKSCWDQCGYVYPYSLREVFGDSIGGCDLQELFEKEPTRVSIQTMVKKLQSDPHYEYLLKMGLWDIAERFTPQMFDEGKGLECIGVSNQYRKIYREARPSYNTHCLLTRIDRVLSADKVKALDALRNTTADTVNAEIITELLHMSVERFINYYTKQLQLNPKEDIKHLMIWRRDYLAMLDTLGLSATSKSELFPADLKAEHDRLAARIQAIEDEKSRKRMELLTQKLRDALPAVRSKEYMLVLPECNGDFVREGQALRHCVGNGTYYKKHCEGNEIILFIRKITEPFKPFVTMQINLKQQSIMQIYGYRDRSPAAPVRSFADRFIKELKKAMSNADEAVLVPAV